MLRGPQVFFPQNVQVSKQPESLLDFNLSNDLSSFLLILSTPLWLALAGFPGTLACCVIT